MFFDMSEIATRTLFALAQRKRAISEHAQEHARPLGRRFLTFGSLESKNYPMLFKSIKEIIRKSLYSK